MQPGFARLLEGSQTFATVANQADYGFTTQVAKILAIRDTAHRRRLIQESESWYRAMAPDPSRMTGVPAYYIMRGYQSVLAPPSDASQLFLISDNAADTQVAYWEVITSTKNVQTGSVSLNGLTGVSLSSSLTDIIQVTDLYLASSATGSITLREDSAIGTVLGTIVPGSMRTNYQQFSLAPTPSDVWTMTVDFEREITDMVQDTDEPNLPPKFHPMIGIGVRMKEYELRGDSDRWQFTKGEWDLAMGSLTSTISSPPDQLLIPGGRRSKWSSLGPWYPGDSVGPWPSNG